MNIYEVTVQGTTTHRAMVIKAANASRAVEIANESFHPDDREANFSYTIKVINSRGNEGIILMSEV